MLMKITLVAIWLGLWLNAAAIIVRPAHAAECECASELHRIYSVLSDIESYESRR